MITLNVTDFKQYMYCKRIIYFTYCQPVIKKNTYKMKFGQEQHEIVDQLEKRRTLKRYGIEKGKKHFKHKVYSKKYGISGKLDLLIETKKEYIPVEMKYSYNHPGLNHKYQLATYMLILEDDKKQGIRKGIIHIIPDKKTYVYKNNDSLRNKVKEIMDKIRFIINEEYFPAKPKGWKRCKDCEYKKFCGDV